MKYILTIIAIFFIGQSAILAQDTNCDEDLSLSKMTYGYDKSDVEIQSTYDDLYRFAYQDPYQNNWTVGPNPTYGELNIYGNTENIQSIELYSIAGELLQLTEGFDIYNPIDLYNYKSGIYLIRIISLSNEVKTYKIIKR